MIGGPNLVNIVNPLGRLNVIKGVNGSGKSNLYKSLRLLPFPLAQTSPVVPIQTVLAMEL